MAACEKCWADAFGRAKDHPMKSQAEHYQDLLEERRFSPCTPEQQKGERQSLNEGIPDCPDCGGKGMCDKHRREYLKWVYETARDEYYAALEEQISKLEERIKQNVNTRPNNSDKST